MEQTSYQKHRAFPQHCISFSIAETFDHDSHGGLAIIRSGFGNLSNTSKSVLSPKGAQSQEVQIYEMIVLVFYIHSD